MRVGIAVMHTVYDLVTGRTRCGNCNRSVATGQTSCVCGAVLVARLASFGDATAATIGEQELEQR